MIEDFEDGDEFTFGEGIFGYDRDELEECEDDSDDDADADE